MRLALERQTQVFEQKLAVLTEQLNELKGSAPPNWDFYRNKNSARNQVRRIPEHPGIWREVGGLRLMETGRQRGLQSI